MDRRKSLIYPMAILGAVTQTLGKPGVAVAQVTSDGSMATPTMVFTSGNQSTVDGGTSFNNNLFHSFSQFSITPGRMVNFNSAPNVEVIFARVTGGNPSSIRGSIVVPGATDLLLLNPAGIEFSTGAVLTMGGSLVATTAETLNFAEGGSFSAVPTALNDSLLNVNVPSGLQWGAQAAGIELNNQTGLYGGSQDFHLLGGAVTFDNLQLAFGNQNLTVGAVGPNSQVSLASNNGTAQLGSLVVDYSAVNAFADITLSNGSRLTMGGPTPGDILLQGRRIELLNGSRLSTETSGAGASGTITLNAAERLSLQGLSGLNEVARISVGTSANSAGSGGRLSINAPTVTVLEGAQISADTSGAGNGGLIELNAANLLEVRGEALNDPSRGSGIFITTDTSAVGNAGRLEVNAGTLRLLDGAVIDGRTVNNGNGPTIELNATNLLEIRGSNSLNTRISQVNGHGTAGSSGIGGRVVITTNWLSVQEGGIIDLRPLGSGNGGTLNIDAQDISIVGTGPILGSGIVSLVENGQGGNGGDIEITTARLRLLGGGSILTGAAQAVTGGSLTLQATDLQIDGSGQAGNGQTLASQILNQATLGTSGAVTINATNLDLTAGGMLASNLRGNGTAGPLTVRGDRITIAGDNQSVSRIAALDLSGTGGNFGDLAITANSSLALLNGGRIESQVGGTTTAGNLSVSTADLQVRGQGQTNSQITTLATGGAQGSNLTVNAPQLTLDDGGRIFSQGSNGGRGGAVGITSNDLNILNTTGDPSRFSEILLQGMTGGQAGDATITADALRVMNNSRIRLLGDNNSTGSNLDVTANSLALEGGVIQSQLNGATRGNIDLAIANGITLSNGAEIKTELANAANGGNLTITTAGDIMAAGNSDIYTTVNAAQGGNITVTANALVDLEVRSVLTPNNDLVTGGNLALTLTPLLLEPPIDPSVETTIEPPVAPPPVAPPPVAPRPVAPPLLPPVESIPPLNPALPQSVSLSGLIQIAAGIQPQPEEQSSRNREDVEVALKHATTMQDEEIVPGCIAGPDHRFVRTGKGGLPDNPHHARLSTPLWQDSAAVPGAMGRVQPEAPQAEWSAPTVKPKAAPAMAEVQGWARSESGQVELLAKAALPVHALGCGQSLHLSGKANLGGKNASSPNTP